MILFAHLWLEINSLTELAMSMTIKITTFILQVIGEPMPVTKWFSGHKELRGLDHIKVQHLDYNTKLSVRMAQRGDAGLYRVTAENVNGKDSVEVEVIVIGKSVVI